MESTDKGPLHSNIPVQLMTPEQRIAARRERVTAKRLSRTAAQGGKLAHSNTESGKS
jgi:hypothetical protein